MNTCKTLRTTAILSFGLLVAGTLLLLLAELIALPMPLIYLALWLVVGAAATLLAALLIAIWPGKRADLTGCQH